MKPPFPLRLLAVVVPLIPALLLAAALAATAHHRASASARHAGRTSVRPAPDRARVAAAFGKLPLAFEENRGQADLRARFLARGPGYTLALTPTEARLSLASEDSPPRHPPTGHPCRGDEREQPRTGARIPAKHRSTFASGRTPHPSSHSPEPLCAGALWAGDSAVQPSGRTMLRMELVGANPAARIAGDKPLPGKSHYLIGNDPKQWRTHVPQFGRVQCKGIYPGIDLVYYGNQGRLEHDFIVAPGADPSAIRLHYAGAESLQVDERGDLVLQVPGGEVRQQKPVIYQEVGGERRLVQGGYEVVQTHPVPNAEGTRGPRGYPGYRIRSPLKRTRPGHRRLSLVHEASWRVARVPAGTAGAFSIGHAARQRVGGLKARRSRPTQVAFRLGPYDRRQPLIIDPQLLYSTYLGSTGHASANAVAIDATGNVYLAGGTTSAGLPLVNAAQAQPGGQIDAFVSKLSADGSALLYSTYLGGSVHDVAFGIAVGAAGDACVVGTTASSNFPTVNGIQSKYGGGNEDAFVTKLDPSGGALVYSTYLGGSGDKDRAFGVAVDAADNDYVVGWTNSPDFPTANALQPKLLGSVNGFVAKLSPTGSSLVYSTYLGGTAAEAAYGVAVDAAGNAYVAGGTSSTDFPTVNPLQPKNAGGGDGFVAKLNPAGSALVYATYLGGSGGDDAKGIAVDETGAVYVAGGTLSSDFPTVNPLQSRNAGGGDAYVAKLNPAGSALVYSTYLGGSGEEDLGPGGCIGVDAAGNAYVAGQTLSPDFPTVNAAQSAFGGGGHDTFAAELNADGSALVYSTYLGGSNDDGGGSIAVDAAGNAYVAGATASSDFPTTPNALQRTLLGEADAFIARIGSAAGPPTYAISGTVLLNGRGLPGVTVSAGARSTISDANGAYRIAGLAGGDYTVVPSLAEYTFSPASASVTVGPSQSGVDFAATRSTYTISGKVVEGQQGLPGVTVSAGGHSAVSAADGTYQIQGLLAGTYTLIPSLAEYTFNPTSASVTVGPSQSGVDFAATRITYSISGTVRLGNAGLPGVTVAAGGQAAVTDAKGQYQISGLVSGDYTVTPSLAEYTFSPSSQELTLGPSQSGIDFTAARDTYTISGTVREGQSGLTGVTVTAGGQSAVTDGGGRYQIAGLVSGSYTVVPSLAEYTFAPPGAVVTLGPSQSGVDFTATRITYTISGTVRLGSSGLAGVTVAAGRRSAITDANGNYQLGGLISGSYTVAPSLAEYTFAPPSLSVTLGPSQSGVDFTATRITYSLSGTVREKFQPLAGASVSLGGQTVITGSSGSYQFAGLISGNYTVSVSKPEYRFVPSSRPVTLGPSQSGIDFSGLPSLPAAPSNLKAVALSAASVRLTWTDNSDNETGFKVERANPPDGALGAFTQIAILPANTTSYVDTTAQGSGSYMYRVRATNGGGDSAPSNVASVTMPAGVLSVTLSPNSVRGGGSVRGTVTLTGPAPAGAKVALSVSNRSFALVKPASVTIPKGKKKASFTVSTRSVIATTPVTVSAAYHDSSAGAVLLINP